MPMAGFRKYIKSLQPDTINGFQVVSLTNI